MEMRPGYTRTDIGVIPDEWDAATIGSVASFSGGSQPAKSTFQYSPAEGYIRLIQIRDYKTDEFETYIPVSLARKRCTASDIMIGRYGPPIFQILRGIEGAYNVALIKATPNRSIDREFFFFVLQQDPLFQLIDSLSRRSSGQTGIEMPALKAYGVPLPPLPEQRAIAAALRDVDALLGGLGRLIAKKRDLKQAAMQQLLTGQIRLPGFHGEWEVKRLGEIAALNRVNVVPALQPTKLFTHFSLPAFDAGMNAQIELGSSIGSNKFAVPASSVLVSKLNPRIPRIWAPPSVPESAVASTEWLVLTPRDGVDRQYLFTLCSSPAFSEQMELAATGTTGSHQRVSPTTALDIRIDFAIDPDEQTAIAAVLSDMDAELSALEARRDKTRALKQGMMQELLTGRTRLV